MAQCQIRRESKVSTCDSVHSVDSVHMDNSYHFSMIQIYSYNGFWQISKQFINLPRAGRTHRADGQINVYSHVRTLIQELSQDSPRAGGQFMSFLYNSNLWHDGVMAALFHRSSRICPVPKTVPH
ncbi:MAG: hypothetical protein EZS28_011924 [Streblomastix strix]|uniref:Uncharacterized protein n=1 Tax=Streblomastix strix TaxID=222440 RepID=A0A5J4WCC7_9EUKA|nr:MAG: hypothetical protein EZS28_011924 [Streblomastix strix]